MLVAAGGDVRKPDGGALRYGMLRRRQFSRPGFIASGDGAACGADLLRTSVRCISGQFRSAASMAFSGSAGKGRPRLGAVEQIKPLLRDQPELGMPRRCRAARHRHRIMAAEARRIDLGSACEGRTVAFVLEPPGGAAGAQFQAGAALFRRGIDKIGNRIPPSKADRALPAIATC